MEIIPLHSLRAPLDAARNQAHALIAATDPVCCEEPAHRDLVDALEAVCDARLADEHLEAALRDALRETRDDAERTGVDMPLVQRLAD